MTSRLTQVLRRRARMVAFAFVVPVFVAAMILVFVTPKYTATTRIRIDPSASVTGDQSVDIARTDRVVNTLTNQLRGENVRSQLRDDLRRDGVAAADLDGLKVEATVPSNTDLIDLSVEAPDADVAARAANNLADVAGELYRDQVAVTYAPLLADVTKRADAARADLDAARAAHSSAVDDANGQSSPAVDAAAIELQRAADEAATATAEQARVETQKTATVSALSRTGGPARVPSSPSSPPRVIAPLAVLLGLAAAIGLAAIAERVRPRVYDETDIDTGTSRRAAGPVPVRAPSSPADESVYGRLVLTLSAGTLGAGAFVVTGATRAEPTAALVRNLALAFARTNRQVAVVDADTATPAMHRAFGVANDTGLHEVLHANVDVEDALQKSELLGVVVLPGGAAQRGEQVVAGTDAWDRLLARLMRTFDVVLVNAPPLLEGIEASLLVAAQARSLLVVNLGRTARADLESARRQLEAAGADFVVVQTTGAPPKRTKRASVVPTRVETFAAPGDAVDDDLAEADEDDETVLNATRDGASPVATRAPDTVTSEPLPDAATGNDIGTRRKGRMRRAPAATNSLTEPQREGSGPSSTDESTGDAPVKPKQQARVTRPPARTVPAKHGPRRARTETVIDPEPDHSTDAAPTGDEPGADATGDAP